LSASGTFPRQKATLLAAIGACLLWPGSASALDPEWTVAQYLRERWTAERGYPGGPVHAIVQTPDGYLWVAGERGLVRFDGQTFRLFAADHDAPGAGDGVLGLAVDGRGELWGRLQAPALGRLAGGALRIGPSGPDARGAVITAMHARRDGSLLVATLGQGILVVQGTAFSTLVPATDIPNSFVLSMAEAGGVLWLGTRDSGLLRVEPSGVTRVTAGLPDLKVNALAAVGEAELLVGTDRGLARWTARGIDQDAHLASVGTTPVLATTRDVDGSIWIAAGTRGLLRLARGRVERLESGGEAASVTTVFEDRERNIWVGTDRGVERLRDGVFLSYSAHEGLPAGAAGAVHVDDTGATWVAHAAGGLFEVRDGIARRVPLPALDGDVIYSIAGSARELWLARQHGGLTRLSREAGGLSVRTFTTRDGLPQNSVYAVCRARDGSIWAGTLSGGVVHLGAGRPRVYTTADGLTSNTVNAIAEGEGGVMWFATPTGVNALTPGGWRRYTRADGLPSNDAHTLFVDSARRLWIGTSDGVGFVDRGQLQVPASVPVSLRRAVVGIAEDRLGWLWISTAERVLRVRLEKLAGGVVSSADVSEYGVEDGLTALEGVRRFRSVVADPHGRVWMATIRGLSAADPVHAAATAAPPAVHVTSLVVDGEPLAVGSDIAPGSRRVAFGFAGVSLARPDAVRYRYRLDGFDVEWSDIVSVREAVYTNLAPGSYRFRVMASGGDGSWSGAEASLPFAVLPALWQTRWFQWMLASVVLLAVAGLYQLRLRQVARQMNARFEERLSERTRIAQDLHDTLLQGFISASMQLHVAADSVPADLPARKSLAAVHALMRQVIAQGRQAVRGLRAEPDAGLMLDDAFARLPAELAPGSPVEFDIQVVGDRRALHPLVYEGVYRIGREAVVNAYRHADARRIEVALEYGPAEFCLQVRDDGRGMDEPTQRAGRDGHWGLAGMRERADDIGARLTLWSRAPVGTGIELAIPNALAHRRPRPEGRDASWFNRFTRRQSPGAGDR
jgi:signal transduction histidine kinase/ligand-binding sensor domain-containing protein